MKSRSPPPFNPYSASGGRENTIHKLKQKFILALVIISLLATWFLTPIADIITTLILFTVPISTDVQLGLESWHTMLKTNPRKYQFVRDQWGVESIGFDLVDSVLMNKYNVDQFCDSIAKTLISSPTSNNDSKQSSLGGLTSTLLNNVFDAKENCKQQVSKYNWSFEVIHSSDINAFALPGGLIRVTDSLLLNLNLSKGEIAALLGHEMSHVLYRHSQSQLLKKDLFNTIVKAIFYDDDDDHEESFGEAIHELMIKSASFLGTLKFSRRNEYQADNGAWEILSHGGRFNPRNVQYLLEKLYSLEDSIDGGSNRNREKRRTSKSYFSAWDKTHPGTGDRIQVLEEKWNRLKWGEQRKFQMRE